MKSYERVVIKCIDINVINELKVLYEGKNDNGDLIISRSNNILKIQNIKGDTDYDLLILSDKYNNQRISVKYNLGTESYTRSYFVEYLNVQATLSNIDIQ